MKNLRFFLDNTNQLSILSTSVISEKKFNEELNFLKRALKSECLIQSRDLDIKLQDLLSFSFIFDYKVDEVKKLTKIYNEVDKEVLPQKVIIGSFSPTSIFGDDIFSFNLNSEYFSLREIKDNNDDNDDDDYNYYYGDVTMVLLSDASTRLFRVEKEIRDEIETFINGIARKHYISGVSKSERDLFNMYANLKL